METFLMPMALANLFGSSPLMIAFYDRSRRNIISFSYAFCWTMDRQVRQCAVVAACGMLLEFEKKNSLVHAYEYAYGAFTAVCICSLCTLLWYWLSSRQLNQIQAL
ncbi:hypothetical protein [Paenibacillus solanacearum]|uniref:hypothetical protein n=1 Tax=Paenibacillus solanacearum TaxID=2048548 RepID=UPI001C407C33|nr:hypothetical protein [Paenibacillus solanacearum]